MPRLSKIGAACLAAFGWTSGTSVTPVTASYLQVAGGGGGARGNGGGGGGGGAGGYLTGTTTLDPTLSYTVVVGAGGGGAPAGGGPTKGSNSQFGSLTASVGGGYGGMFQSGIGVGTGGNGGSGGGAGDSSPGASGGTATSGQGNNGGASNGSGPQNGGGGGGGAGAVGQDGTASSSGNGGNGTASSISGSSVTYAGGGGAGNGYNSGGGNGTPGTGGTGGGGAGGTYGTSGTANLGGGGGGANFISNSSATGGNGGSGVVIISYAGAQQFGGGVVTSVGGNTIHTFNTSGTLSPITPLSASYLIVAGGGAGGYFGGAGGGAGGMLTGSGVTIDTNSTYLVTVGSGGAGVNSASAGNSGTNSNLSIVSTAAIGGGGGGGNSATVNGRDGGSGGGASFSPAGATNSPGTGTAGQGNNGGNAASNGAGGGGGAGAVGGSASGGNAGNGGVGLTSSISGTSTYYAGGGGGYGDTTRGSGGNGGGGSGAGVSGTANTGGGGGGWDGTTTFSGSGGSGIVIISYAGSTQQMAGGTVTITGGNVIHTFTSSGYLTPLTFSNNSLRFRASNSAYLTRTPTVAGNQQKFTISAWVKRGNISAYDSTIISSGDTTNGFSLYLGADSGAIVYNRVSSTSYYIQGSSVWRDPAAWYHLVLAVDTTQATAANRMILYKNGTQDTTFAPTNTQVAQNSNITFNNASQHRIGYTSQFGSYSDVYLADFRFVDGQALTANSFGAFNSYGVWQPINYGGSYGTNGYYLPFTTNASGYSGSFSGSNYLSLTDSSNTQDLGTSTSLEMFYYPTSLANLQGLYMKGGGANAWNSTNGIYYSILFNTSGNLICTYYTGGTSNGSITDPTARALNRWYHIALVANSTTLSLFVNGARVATATVVPSKPTTRTTVYMGNTFAGGENVRGLMSNVRFLSGSNAYDASAATITVPTTTLTAVTGTQLLTLQNATIIDNSTNAFSITNTGTVTTGITYPLATSIFNDQGPAGNNWTPNNISGNIGSTLDYMTDVPTLTSATASNYCVGNPLDIGQTSTFTDGNLNFTTSSTTNYSIARGSIGVSSGKWYWEVTAQSSSTGNGMGIATSQASLNNYLGGDAYGYCYYANGQKYNNATGASYGASYTTNDVIGVALDLDGGTLTFYKNNSSQGTAYSSLSGTFFPAVTDGSSGATSSMTLNFGQQPFVYTPPTGFVALNTYNL